MAFTRLRDDVCSYNHYLKESTSILNFTLDPNKYYSCKPCRISEGIIGGNNVSVFKGNLVDLESDLRGQTRMASKCPTNLFQVGTTVQGKPLNNCSESCMHGDKLSSLPCAKAVCDKNLKHLPECNIINMRPKIKNTGINLDIPKCGIIKATKRATTKKPKLDMYWQGNQGMYQ